MSAWTPTHYVRLLRGTDWYAEVTDGRLWGEEYGVLWALCRDGSNGPEAVANGDAETIEQAQARAEDAFLRWTGGV